MKSLLILTLQIIALFVPVTVMAGAADFEILTKEEAAEFEYTYNGVSYNLTQRAVGAEQVLAMLDYIYNEPAVPGTIYEPGDEDVKIMWNYPGGDEQVEGLTVVLVEVDSSNKISAAQVETDAIRLTSDSNPGWVFNIDTSLNRFFFLLKGRVRHQVGSALGGSTVNTQTQFEEMSASYSGYSSSGEQEVYNCYDYIVNKGERFRILHDCMVMLESRHYFFMGATADDVQDYKINMCLFVPDNRMKNWKRGEFEGYNMDRDTNGKYTWYNPSYSPYIFTYSILQNVPQVTVSDDGRTADIHLSWVSSFDDMVSDNTVEQEYYVYLVDDAGNVSTEPLNSSPLNVPEYDIKDCELTDEPQSYTYVIKGCPKESSFSPVQSNERVAMLPSAHIVNVPIDVYHTSVYNHTDRCNEYANTVILSNKENFGVPLEYALQEGSRFEFLRDGGVIATVTLSGSVDEGIYYMFDGSDVKYGLPTPAEGDYNVDFGADGVSYVDKFSAVVDDNGHPDAYNYQIVFHYNHNGDDAAVQSAKVTVNIPKTELEVNHTVSHSRDEVDGDEDGSLDSGLTSTLVLAVENKPQLRSYVVWRGGYGDANGGVKIAEALHDAVGSTYNCVVRDVDGEYVSAGTLTAQGINDFVFCDELSAATIGYIPVIEAYDDSDMTRFNTYGSPVKEIGVAAVELSADDCLTFNAGEFSCHLAWKPMYDPALYTPVLYRLWRSVAGGQEQLIGAFTADELEMEDGKAVMTDAFKYADNSVGAVYRIRLYAQENSSGMYIVAESSDNSEYLLSTGVSNPGTGEAQVAVDGGCIVAPEDAAVYTVSGVRVAPTGLVPGIYIVVSQGVAQKVFVR